LAIDRYKTAFEAASKLQEQALGRQIDQWASPKGSGGGQLNRRDFAKELKTYAAKSLTENIPNTSTAADKNERTLYHAVHTALSKSKYPTEETT
jgi:hypothetical protein